jgi:hypothetical protein
MQQPKSAFRQWRNSLPTNLQEDQDYDLQGYYNKYGNRGLAANGHLPDEFKKPNHVTFSNESVYSNPKTPGGQWSEQNNVWHFKPSDYNINNVGADSLRNYFKQNEPDSKLDMKEKGGTMKRGMFIRKKMEQGGWANANDWANKNQKGISGAGQFAATAVDAFAPTDAYGVRSNGAALGSGALKGATAGAALGSSIPVIGTIAGGAVGAVVGGVSGLLGNKSANAAKTSAINQSTTSQLAAMQQGAEARLAGDPSLKYGRQDASYYRFGGTMKGTGPTPPRNMPAIPAVQGKPRLMPNISTAPARQISRMAQGGSIEPMSSQDVKVEGPSHAAGGVPIPSMGVELEGGETVNNGFVFSKKLGFAKPAEAIAKQLGKAEARPENSINKATVAALQRKTELLKVHQEAAKQAAGIPNDLQQKADGGPIMRSDTTVNRNAPTYDPTLLSANGKFMVSKPDGSIGQWGNELPIIGNSPAIPVPPMAAPLRMSDKARGLSNSFYPANNNAANPTPAAIKSTTGRTYKFGGNMKKMAEGGKDPLYPNSAIPYMDVPNFTGSTPVISGLPFTRDQQIPVTQKPAITPVPQTLQGGTTPRPLSLPDYTLPETKSNGVMKAFDKVSPFLSNIANATTKLPLPPVPVLNTEITPNLVDYSASRAEAVRTNRGADKTARQNLNTGAAVAASTAANLSQRVRSVGQINEAENNANTGIRNQVASQNAQVKMGNTALQNNYQNELVSRQLKGQQLKSENMANVEQKIQGMAKDDKLNKLESTKIMLTALSDPTGASMRGADSVFKGALSPEDYQTVKAHAAKISARYAQDQAEDSKNRIAHSNWMLANPSKSATDSPYYNLLGQGAPSVISTGDLKKTGTTTKSSDGKTKQTTYNH